MNAYSIYLTLAVISCMTYFLWYVIYDHKFFHHPLMAIRILDSWNKIINGTAVYVFVLIAVIYNFAADNVKQEFTANCITDLTGFTLKICVFTNAIKLIVDIIYNFPKVNLKKKTEKNK